MLTERQLTEVTQTAIGFHPQELRQYTEFAAA
jgi:hypothetical protein